MSIASSADGNKLVAVAKDHVIYTSRDGGATWTTYQTAGAVIDKGVNWHFVYRPERPGRYLLKVRAVDGDGTVSDIVAEYAFEVES